MASLKTKYKVVLLGASSVGKTSLVTRFSKGTFSEPESTIGAAFLSRDVQTGDGPVSLHVWDTAGQERYRALIPRYSQRAAAVLLVYDVSDPQSFEAVKELLVETREVNGPNVVWFLVGNKSDLEQVVSEEDAREFAEQERMNFILTSAKTGESVQELFVKVAELVPKIKMDKSGVDIDGGDGREPRGCCG